MRIGKAGKYDALYKWLLASQRPRITASFRQIEGILGSELPATARMRPQWWGNEITNSSKHVQCNAWLRAGYRAENLQLLRQTVDFAKT